LQLDTREDGQDIQDVLLGMTGARTVPRVFVGGKFIGGGDDTVAMVSTGQLKALYEALWGGGDGGKGGDL
jgi:glutaredoxin 3